MEFLRFGSQIPGACIGCCAADIIQGFNVDPDDKASIQLVAGDGGSPVLDRDGKGRYAGPTYLDIFKQRLRVGTFYDDDMKNHMFLAIITGTQLRNENGKKWLAILKEHGFEFIRAVDNSVYSGGRRPPNYLFGLFRHVDKKATLDPFAPPPEWTDLPECTRTQQEVWDWIGPATFLTEEEVVAAGAPVILAGAKRYSPQEKSLRLEIENRIKGDTKKNYPPAADPFGQQQAEYYPGEATH